MGNLVASLIAAESIVTTEAKAKALRPVVEKCVTAARKGGVAQPPQRGGPHPRQGHDPQALRGDRAALRRAAGRLHPDPEARPAAGRQRADGAHRVRLRVERLRRAPRSAGGSIAYDGAAFHGFAAQPGVRTVAGALARRSRTARLADGAARHLRGPDRRGRARPRPGRPRRPSGHPRRRRQAGPRPPPAARPRDRGAPGRGGRPGLRRAPLGDVRTLPLPRVERPRPGPPPGVARLAGRGPLDLRAMQAASDVLLGKHDFRAFCRRPAGTDAASPWCAGSSTARWSVDRGPEAVDAAAADGGARLLRFEIGAASFCHQMVRSLVASLVEVGRGQENAADLIERLRAGARPRMPDPAPADGLCLVSVAYGPGAGAGRLSPARRSARRLAPPARGPILVRRPRTPGPSDPPRCPSGGDGPPADAKIGRAHIFTEGQRDPAELARRRRRRPRPRAPGLRGRRHPARQAPSLLRPAPRHRRPRDRGQRRQGASSRRTRPPTSWPTATPATPAACGPPPTPRCSRRSPPSSSGAPSAACCPAHARPPDAGQAVGLRRPRASARGPVARALERPRPAAPASPRTRKTPPSQCPNH